VKRTSGSHRVILAAVAILIAVPASVNALPTAVQPGDFQGNNNGHPDAAGSGTWHYMYSNTLNPTLGTAGLLTWNATDSEYDVGAGDWYPDVALMGGSLTMAPEASGALATRYGFTRWTSGVSGTVNVAGSWTHYYSSGSDGIEVAIFADGAQQFSTLLLSGTTAFNFDVLVAPGSKIDFVVGPGAAGDGGYDRAILQTTIAVVPAPGAVLLAGLGAALVGWLRRRRSM
jgi:hypothetical protein